MGGAGVLGLRAAGAGARSLLQRPQRTPPHGPQAGPAGPALPARQHAWIDHLPTDRYGNPLAPRFDRLLFFDVRGPATARHAQRLEAALQALERRYRWGADGLLFTVSWGHSYFSGVLGVSSPVPRATRLSSFERPVIDDYHLCIHLACNTERRLDAIEAALVRGRRLPGVPGSLALEPALIWRQTRRGFTGAGLPAARQHVGGIPAGDPVQASAPLFMGFRSGLLRNQATEDAVTIESGVFRGGTTMQVSQMELQLDDWYGLLSARQRVALMYSPQTTPAQLRAITTDAPGDPRQLTQAIRQYGVIGHAQAAAQARRAGRPLIIRRDFDTTDGGHAGVHFVSVQRSIDDFIVTRNAMNAAGAHLADRRITATANNGINAFINVRRRANYLMPSRADRSFPLLGAQRPLAMELAADG